MSNIDGKTYGMHSCDYMGRAHACLNEGTEQALIYAAFELRAGIESRLRQYLEGRIAVSKKASIKKLGSRLEGAFSTGDRVVELSIYKEKNKSAELLGTFYYTPVTSSLRKKAEKLGDYLHGTGAHAEIWWVQTRQFLENTYTELFEANLGNLIGPPMIDTETRTAELTLDLHDSYQRISRKWIHKAKIGERLMFKVKYLEGHPMTKLVQ